jgi:hypothetical protein
MQIPMHWCGPIPIGTAVLNSTVPWKSVLGMG